MPPWRLFAVSNILITIHNNLQWRGGMGKFPLVRIMDFISRVFPFDTLEKEELDGVVGHMELAYFPRGETIIKAGGEPARNLFIIHSGSVRVTLPSEKAEDYLIDVRGEGDIFGAVSLLQSTEAIFSVTAQEDLLAFLLPAADFKRLIDEHEVFQRHFSLSLARNIRAVCDSSQSHPGHVFGVDSLKEMAVQMRGRVAELMSSNVLICHPEKSIREAAMEMTRREVGSIVVVNGNGNPLGMVTDTDLRVRVLAAGLSPDNKVAEVMSQPPLTIAPQSFAFEAMLDMTRHGVHHLLVTEGERMVGVISDHDMKVVTGSTPVGLAREIDKVSSMGELARFPERIRRVLELLVNLGSSAGYMMDLVNEFMDRLYIKLFELCEKQMAEEGLGAAPAEYTWLALGRAGRKEQAPPVRQESALVFADVPPEQEGVVREWFIGFSRRVGEALNRWRFCCGSQEQSTGGAAWCRSAVIWRRTYLDWVRDPAFLPAGDPGAVFDFRTLHGDPEFGKTLRESLWAELDENPVFLEVLLRRETAVRPPLGFFRQFLVEKDGLYSDRLDLEGHGLRLFSGAVRIMALEGKLEETNTLARLRAAADRWSMARHFEDDLYEAFNFMTVLWISRYLETTAADAAEGGRIDPASLNMMQKKMLKESFAVIGRLQDLLKARLAHGAAG